MRLEQLEYVAAVVRHGSLRRAAEALHVSQPALSEGIGKLERELGVILLDRHRSGARVSTGGRRLLPSITSVLDAADDLRGAAGIARTAGPALRVGAIAGSASLVVAPAIAELRDQHADQHAERTPSWAVEVRDLNQPEIRDGLVDGSLDLGLVTLLDDDPATVELEASPLVLGRPVVVVPADAPVAARPHLTPADLQVEQLVSLRQGDAMQRLTARLLGPDTPAPTYVADGSGSALQSVAQGLGVTVLPDFLAGPDPLVTAGLLRILPLVETDATVSLVLWRRRHRQPDAAAVGLITSLLRRARAA